MSYPIEYLPAETPPSGKARAGTRNLWAAVVKKWPAATNLGIYNPRDVCGNAWPNFKCSPSQHATGRALDIGIPDAARPHLGTSIARALVGNAAQLGVTEAIWSRQRWTAAAGWRTYTGRSPHLDHVHVTLHPTAADRLTLAEASAALYVVAATSTPPRPQETDDMTPAQAATLDALRITQLEVQEAIAGLIHRAEVAENRALRMVVDDVDGTTHLLIPGLFRTGHLGAHVEAYRTGLGYTLPLPEWGHDALMATPTV